MLLFSSRGELSILKSNMEKSSQTHATQLRDVKLTQSTVKHEHEKELKELRTQLENLRNEHVFAKNDLMVLRQDKATLERKLRELDGREVGPSQSQHSQALNPTTLAPPSQPERELPVKPVAKKPQGVLLKDSYMDGFSVPFPTPTKKRPAVSTISGVHSPKKHKPTLLAFGSSTTRTPSSQSASAEEPLPSDEFYDPVNLDDPDNEPSPRDLEEELQAVRSDAKIASLNAARTSSILSFIDSVLSFNISGLGEAFKFLERYEIELSSGKQSVASHLRDSLLQDDPHFSTVQKVVKRFAGRCVDIMENCTTNMKNLMVVPIVSQLIIRALLIEFEVIIKDTNCVRMLDGLVNKMLENIKKAESVNDEITLETGYRVYVLYFAVEVLEHIAYAADKEDLQRIIWQHFQPSTLLRILQPEVPISFKITVIDILSTSITQGSYSLFTEDDFADLLGCISEMLVNRHRTSIYELLTGLKPFTDFRYVPFHTYHSVDSKISTSPFRTSKHFSAVELSQLHISHTLIFRRATIQLFVQLLIQQGKDISPTLLTSVISCLSTELDYTLTCISPSSESILLVSDCVSFLHAMLHFAPDVLSQIRQLSGSAPHEYMVSLSKIFFNDPPASSNNDDAYDLSEGDVDGLETMNDTGVVFGSYVTQKVWELLEKYVTPEEAGDLFASMSIPQASEKINEE